MDKQNFVKPAFENLKKPYKYIQIAIKKEKFNIEKSEDENYIYLKIPTKQALNIAKDIIFLKENSKDFDFESV